MRIYKVLVSGENCVLNVDGEPKRLGFFTTRFVEATYPAEANRLALEMIEHDLKRRGCVFNNQTLAPTLHIEQNEEVTELEPQTGFSFYPQESTNEN